MPNGGMVIPNMDGGYYLHDGEPFYSYDGKNKKKKQTIIEKGHTEEIILTWEEYKTIRACFIVADIRHKIGELKDLLEYHKILAKILPKEVKEVKRIADKWGDQFNAYGGNTGRSSPLIKVK